MINRKATFVTADGKWQMIYTPQRKLSSYSTRLASFELHKYADRGDLGEAYVMVKGHAENYVPSEAFPLREHIDKVMQMLVTDYSVQEWFEKRKVAND